MLHKSVIAVIEHFLNSSLASPVTCKIQVLFILALDTVCDITITRADVT